MTEKLDLHRIVAFTRLIEPSLPLSDDYCGCNAACGCNDKPSCCEQKCGCNQKTLLSNPGDDGDSRAISTLSDPSYGAILASFDPNAVKTISDFLNLVDQVRDKLKG